MANPPLLPDGFTATTPDNPVTHGKICHYGLNDLVLTAGILIDSYKRDAKYAKVDEVMGQNGLVVGVRMSDYRVEISVSGRIETTASYTGKVGDILSLSNGDKGVITQISMSASGTGFTTLDISATAYEGISAIAPV